VPRNGYARTRRLAAGRVLVAAGLERALTSWNDQLALLPWGLSRILGITVYLEIPASLPIVAAVAGGGLVLLGFALLATGRRGWRPARPR
jgi:hypothetical protein